MSACEDPTGSYPPRGEQRARREGRVLRVQQHLVPHNKLHVPPGGVELRHAHVLPLLQQGPHFSSHAPHKGSSSLAGPRWVECSGKGQGAAGVLAVVGVEGRVADPQGRR